MVSNLIVKPITARPFRISIGAIAILFCSIPNVLAGQLERDQAVVESLLRLGSDGVAIVDKNERIKDRVDGYLKTNAGTRTYLDVVSRLQLKGHSEELTDFLKPEVDASLQAEAVRLLIRNKDLETVNEVLAENDAMATAAANALGLVNDRDARELLRSLVTSDSAGQAVKIAATNAIGRSKDGQEFLLDLARKDQLPAECKFPAYNVLASSRENVIREEAEKLLKPEPATGGETLPPIRRLIVRRGDAKSGKQVFLGKGTCGNCHKVLGEGKEVGPDLSEIGSKLSREAMYVAILNPNAGISHNFEQYTLLTVDGMVLNGLLVSETEDQITLRTPEGVERSTPQDDVEIFEQSSVSIMPENLHKAMSVQELVDLVDYLSLLKKKDEQGFHQIASDQSAKKVEPESRESSAAVAGIDTRDGLDVKLFSAEPDLLSPSNLDVDHLGRVWVCEVVNYRHFRNRNNPVREAGDRILVLQDTTGDGACDKQTVFYQGRDIDSPHGVCVLGNRVIVSAQGNIISLVDTDGDLKADEKTILFSGIGGPDHDHGIHAVVPGPDGKLYFNFGNEGHQLKGPDGKVIVDRSGNDASEESAGYQQGMVFRCDPDGGNVETLGWNFRNPWELCVDSFGTIWQSDNDDDGNRATRINYVMQYGNYGYRDELTGDRWTAPRTGMSDEIPLRHWHLNDPGVVPNVLQTGAGSPSGIMIYEGDLLPAEFRQQLIHCDPGPNSVRAYPIQDDGAGYQASQIEIAQGTRDQWFRPVDAAAAPDGSIFIADWYDPGVGGHRMSDTKRGRVFRISPTGSQDTYQVPDYDLSTTEGATAALRSPNVSARFLAAQALRKMGAAAEAPLATILENEERDTFRARALWVLGDIDPAKYVKIAMNDKSPDIRVVGVRIAVGQELDILETLGDFAGDPSPKVRRELALSLHGLTSKSAAEMWAKLAIQHQAGERWYLEALGIGASENWDSCLKAWKDMTGKNWNNEAGREIIWRSRATGTCNDLAKLIVDPQVSSKEQLKYFRALDFCPRGKAKTAALESIATTAQSTND